MLVALACSFIFQATAGSLELRLMRTIDVASTGGWVQPSAALPSPPLLPAGPRGLGADVNVPPAHAGAPFGERVHFSRARPS